MLNGASLGSTASIVPFVPRLRLPPNAVRSEASTPAVAGVTDFGPQPADKVDELTQARNQLVAALGDSGAKDVPEDAALAQTFYACWVEQQHENFQPRDIAYCRDGFYKHMAVLNDAVIPEAPDLVALQSDVFFDFDKYNLKPAAVAELEKVYPVMVADTTSQFLIGGHTDTVGSAAYNAPAPRPIPPSRHRHAQPENRQDGAHEVQPFGLGRLDVNHPPGQPEDHHGHDDFADEHPTPRGVGGDQATQDGSDSDRDGRRRSDQPIRLRAARRRHVRRDEGYDRRHDERCAYPLQQRPADDEPRQRRSQCGRQ